MRLFRIVKQAANAAMSSSAAPSLLLSGGGRAATAAISSRQHDRQSCASFARASSGALRMFQCEKGALLRPSASGAQLGERWTQPQPQRQSRRPAATAAAATAAAGGGAAGGGAAAAAPLAALPPTRPIRPKGGALQGVPVVSPPEEILVSALKRAARVGPSPTATRAGGGEAAKERSRAARQLDALMKELSVPLGRYVAGFPPAPLHLMVAEGMGEKGAGGGSSGGGGGGGSGSGSSGSGSGTTTTAPAPPRRSAAAGGGASLHPFDAALLDLTVAGGARGYAASLSRVDALRKSLQQTGKAFAGRAASAANAAAAKALLEEGTAELSRLFRRGSGCVRDLGAAARRLRRLPQVDPTLPTVALVGAPNVGKSSLVRALSSGAPAVCDYPFTTRSVALGHFFAPGPAPLGVGRGGEEEEEDLGERRRRQQQRPLRRHQVTDTPGLLDREDPERNAMERLTLACVAHLPGAAVLFVADLTEGCGASVAQQWRVRRRLREGFPHRAWVDVLSKGDLLEPLWEEGGGVLGGGDGAEEEEEDGAAAASGGGVGGGGGGAATATAAALEAAAAAAERAVEAAEAPIGQRGGAREYERAVRLALACRQRREEEEGTRGRARDHGEDAGSISMSSSSSPAPPPSSRAPAPAPLLLLLSPPLAVVRASTLEGPGGLDGLKRAVLDAIAWAERRREAEEAAEDDGAAELDA